MTRHLEKAWADGSGGKTPISASALKDLETRVREEIANTEALSPSVVNRIAEHLNIKDYGAAGDGATDDTAAFEKAAAAWKAGKGELVIPPGTYKLAASELLKLEDVAQSLRGAGKGATFLKPTAAVTGPLITWKCMPASDQPAGIIEGLTINGESAGESAAGLQIGDTMGYSLRDFVVRNFTATGAIGIKMYNADHWTEEGNWSNVTVDNNKTGVEFSKAEAGNVSFAYHTFSGLRINAFKNQTGIRLKGTVKLYNTFLRVTGNLHEEGCVGIELAEESRLWGQLAIALECASAAPVPIKIAAAAAIKRSSGFIDTSEGGGVSTNAGIKNITFNGVFRVPGIVSGITKIVKLTQAELEALEAAKEVDSETLYVVS